MNRSDFDSLASFIQNSAFTDCGAADSALDQIHELRNRVSPNGDPTGTLEAAALLLYHRENIAPSASDELADIIVKLVQTAGSRHSSPDRHQPVVLKAPSPKQAIPSELTETTLRLTSDLYVGEILLRQGSITKDQLEQALRFQQVTGDRLGEALVNLNAVTWKQVQEALCEQRPSR